MEGMKEYIERTEIKSALQPVTRDGSCPLHIAAAVDQVLDCTPAADVVEVVRCRECAHYKICDRWENGRRMLCEIHHHSYLGHDGDKNFCSWGQRKEAEHEVS